MSGNKTRGIKLDFEALSRYGVDSNKKILPKKSSKANQIKPKCLGSLIENDGMGYWSDPSGEKFLSDCSTEMASPDRSKTPQGSESDEERANKTLTNNESDAEASQDGHDSQDESKTSTPVVDGSQKSDDQISLHAKGDFDSPVKEIKVKNIRATKQKIPVKGKGKISVELRAKMDEEKALKKECDSLELEVLQTEKLQDSIDKYKQKIKELKKHKEGDQIRKGVKSVIKESEEISKIKGSVMLSKQEIKAVCLPIFDRLNLKKSDQSEFISELLEHATR